MNDLTPVFEHIREEWAQHGDRLGLEILDRLQHDERMADAWKSWRRHCPDRMRLTTLTSFIRRHRDRADSFSQAPAMKAARDRENVAVRNAVKLLRERFSGPSWPDEINLDTFDVMREEMDQAKQLREALDWAGSYLDRMTDFTIKLLDKEFPSSQKRNDPPVAFQVLLCTTLNEWIGTPLYAFVATITDVVYQLNTTTGEDSVRNAWQRDLEKRASKAV